MSATIIVLPVVRIERVAGEGDGGMSDMTNVVQFVPRGSAVQTLSPQRRPRRLLTSLLPADTR